VESQRVPAIQIHCEPQLGMRGLYPNLSIRDSYGYDVQNLVNVISYLDGNHTISEVAVKCRIEISEVHNILELLSKQELIIQ
jgi:aminopeptidase-like protein